MSEDHPISYPKFQANQVLKASDLNSLHEALAEENFATRVALIGMGIVCGLNGAVDGSLLTIKPGYGVTPAGWIIRRTGLFNIRLDDAGTIPATPDPVLVADLPDTDQDLTDPVKFDQGMSGYSLILEIEVPQPPAGGPCDPENCDQSTFLVEPVIKFKKAPVRLIRSSEILAAENLPRASVDAEGTVYNFDPLKIKLRDGLSEVLSDVSGFDNLIINDSTDPVPTKAYMVGRLNEIREEYYQYLLCKLRSKDCAGFADLDGARNCLILGYLHRDGALWEWQDEYRDRFISAFDALHAFSTCDQFLDRIRTLLGMGVSPPDTTTTTDEEPTFEVHETAEETWVADIQIQNNKQWTFLGEQYYRSWSDPPPITEHQWIGINPDYYTQPGIGLRGHFGFQAGAVKSGLDSAFAQNKIPIDVVVLNVAEITSDSLWSSAESMGGAFHGGTLALVEQNGYVCGDLFLASRGNTVTAGEVSNITSRLQTVQDDLDDPNNGLKAKFDTIESQVSDTSLDARISSKVASEVAAALSGDDFKGKMNIMTGEIEGLKSTVSQTAASTVGVALSDIKTHSDQIAVLRAQVDELMNPKP